MPHIELKLGGKMLRYDLLNINMYKSCKRCGGCCGLVPVSPEDIAEIKAYIKKNKIKINPLQGDLNIVCPFLDKDKKCLIYPVRPLMCRLYRCDSDEIMQEQIARFCNQLPDVNTSVLINTVDWNK